MTAPLMPKATAIWLVENTTLTFRQIAKFCELHELEVQAIADGDIISTMVGANPITNGQLSEEEIKRCEADKSADLVANVMEKNVKERNAKAKRILSPSQRNDKPAAIIWVLKNCPEIVDSQICKLIGTTKPTINKIRNGEYADIEDVYPKNPVAVGLCNEKELEEAIYASQHKGQPRVRKPKKSLEEIAAEKEAKAKERAKARAAKKAAKARAKAKEKARKKKEKEEAKKKAKLAKEQAKAEAKALKAKEKAKEKAKAKAKSAQKKAKAKLKAKEKIAEKKAKAKAKAAAKKEAAKAKAAEKKAKAKAKAAAKKEKAAEKAKAKKIRITPKKKK